METKTTRTPFTPERGKTYLHKDGGTYQCVCSLPGNCALMINTKSGWGFLANGCGRYEDGTMDWDYSTKGRFEETEERA